LLLFLIFGILFFLLHFRWQDDIETELKQLTDYQKFMVPDSGEDIPKGYQKILYHMVLDVKYDLRGKAGLGTGGN
jgi:hypothetical protein